MQVTKKRSSFMIRNTTCDPLVVRVFKLKFGTYPSPPRFWAVDLIKRSPPCRCKCGDGGASQHIPALAREELTQDDGMIVLATAPRGSYISSTRAMRQTT